MNPDKWYWADVLWLVKIMIVVGLLATIIPHYDIIFSDKLPENYAYQINRVDGKIKLIRLPCLPNNETTFNGEKIISIEKIK